MILSLTSILVYNVIKFSDVAMFSFSFLFLSQLLLFSSVFVCCAGYCWEELMWWDFLFVFSSR